MKTEYITYKVKYYTNRPLDIEGDKGAINLKENILLTLINSLHPNQILIIDMDNTFPYSIKFVEEAFSDLLKSPKVNQIKFISNDEPKLVRDIARFYVRHTLDSYNENDIDILEDLGYIHCDKIIESILDAIDYNRFIKINNSKNESLSF